VVNGSVIHNSIGNEQTNLIGFNDKGQLILKEITVREIITNRIQYAVTFNPNLLVNGKPMIEGDGGWGWRMGVSP